jgi:hypothetical protein
MVDPKQVDLGMDVPNYKNQAMLEPELSKKQKRKKKGNELHRPRQHRGLPT